MIFDRCCSCCWWFLVVSLTFVAALNEHSIVEKSVIQAQQECVEYLNLPRHRLYEYLGRNYANDAKTECMIRCVGLNLDWWSGSGVLNEHVIAQYFFSDDGDEHYASRTKACLKHRVTANSSLCGKAFEVFQCYLEQYGELLNCPKVVPLGDERLTESVHFCLDTLEIPLAEFSQSCGVEGFKGSERSRCLLRCIVIRSGLYTDQYGVHSERYQLQFAREFNGKWDDLERDVCATRLRREGHDECSLASHILDDCYDFKTTLLPALNRTLLLLKPLMTQPEPTKGTTLRSSKQNKPT
ncbi:general odorant-binding protein 45-like [Anopheles bellator]|uniref:general odorant-binding protein 45-like n=1 Tax=Anopheles bellator TaxID=139047 RepID=UPI00264787E0|nr:general odorant-binding protein 45-like [Anopheles bellator]